MAGHCETQTISEEQLTEISEVKKSFPGQVRVIADVGEFSRVVTVQPVPDIDVHIKLQLTAKYPAVSPVIIIRSSILTEEQTDGITNCLQLEAESRVGQLLISCLIAACCSWLKENNIQTVVKGASSKSGKKSKSKNRSTAKNTKDNEQLLMEEKSLKKPPMKTASDVIKRIQWDPSLDKDCFIVGYIDRIVGLVEKKFTAFTWEDLATVDIFSLAIPQHRIQYFKYFTEKVWDKNERFDNVFGSTGSKTTIIEAMANFHARQVTEDADNHTPDNNDKEHKECNTDGDSDNFDSEDDPANVDTDLEKDIIDDVGIDKDIRQNDQLKDNYDQEASVSNDVDCEMSPAVTSVAHCYRPNYFAAFHISDHHVRQNLVNAQDQIEAAYPAYSGYRISPNCFHVTLALMNLGSKSEVQKCIDAMESVRDDLASIATEAGSVVLKGIGSFSPRVVFARVHRSPELLEFATRIRQKLDKIGVCVEKSQFNAHVTLFKVPRKETFAVEAINLGRIAAIELGSQHLSNVHVCKMGAVLAGNDDIFGYQSVCYQEFKHCLANDHADPVTYT